MPKNGFKSTLLLWIFALSGLPPSSGQGGEDCAAEDFGHGSIVCVCNATYCDTLGPIDRVPVGQYVVYTSTKDGQRFHRDQFYFTANATEAADANVTINRNRPQQSVLGFGGAFTDASGINIDSLSAGARQNLLRGYFSTDGLEYTFGRVPIAGSDFSTRPYTYDDDHDGDFSLDYFALAPEDAQYKIPQLQEALAMSGRPIRLLASSWSAPTWMKTNEDFVGKGSLKGEPGGQYYQTWADYYVRFLEEYGKSNLTFWGITSQNEPVDGLDPFQSFNALGFTPDTLTTFVGLNLGPALRDGGHGSVQLLSFEDQRFVMKNWTEVLLAEDSPAAQFVDGIAYHWYTNVFTSPEILTETHEAFPDRYILATEHCTGPGPLPNLHVLLGNWERGEEYAIDIIEDLNHWVVGWIDWNLALDQEGGPNWAGNFVDCPVIVDAANDQYFKQPMYYALGHFSKFLPPNSTILGTDDGDVWGDGLYSLTALTPDGATALIILNKLEEPRTILVEDPGYASFTTDVPAKSLRTYLWWQE